MTHKKINVKSSNTQLNKSKSTVKNKTGSSLGVTRKMFEGDVPHELLLRARQFDNKLATDIK